jgi:histidine triad (HIT) family protein
VSDCFICAEHAEMPSTVLAAEEHVVVAHLAGESVHLGYLFVEARRHVPGLGDLNDAEAAAVGRVDEWPGAPRGGEREIAALLARLRAA